MILKSSANHQLSISQPTLRILSFKSKYAAHTVYKEDIEMIKSNIKGLLTAFVSIYLIANIVSAADKKDPEITFSKINDSFWVLHGGNGLGANVGMSIGKDGILLIDSMNIGKGKKLIKAIRSISDKPIKYVINTHQHGDHRGGNEDLVELGATIIYPNFLKYATRYEGAERDIQFQDKLSIKFNDEDFTLYHVKSHTWNDVIVHLKNNNAVFTGDNHATSWGPNIGARGMRSHKEVFDLVLSLTDEKTVVVPGHTALADLEHVKQYDAKTKEWFSHILTLHKQGQSTKSILKTQKIDDLLKWFHGGKEVDWLTEERRLARVTATITSDEGDNIELSAQALKKYSGQYLLQDGGKIEIFIHKNELYGFKSKSYTVHLLPKSATQFSFSGWDENERFDFKFDQQGNVNSLSFQINGKVEFTASKSGKIKQN